MSGARVTCVELHSVRVAEDVIRKIQETPGDVVEFFYIQPGDDAKTNRAGLAKIFEFLGGCDPHSQFFSRVSFDQTMAKYMLDPEPLKGLPLYSLGNLLVDKDCNRVFLSLPLGPNDLSLDLSNCKRTSFFEGIPGLPHVKHVRLALPLSGKLTQLLPPVLSFLGKCNLSTLRISFRNAQFVQAASDKGPAGLAEVFRDRLEDWDKHPQQWLIEVHNQLVRWQVGLSRPVELMLDKSDPLAARMFICTRDMTSVLISKFLR